MAKPSVFVVAYREVQRPVALIVLLTLAMLLSAVYPSRLDSYPPLTQEAQLSVQGEVVNGVEHYLRFVPTVLQVALPLLLGDRVGLVQLLYVGVSTTLATQAGQRLLNDASIEDTRLGQRPSSPSSKHNMPSGHSSMAASAVYYLGRRYGLWIALLMLPILLLTMYARVMLTHHTVSAVLAGALLGFVTTALFTSRRKAPAADSAAPAAARA